MYFIEIEPARFDCERGETKRSNSSVLFVKTVTCQLNSICRIDFTVYVHLIPVSRGHSDGAAEVSDHHSIMLPEACPKTGFKSCNLIYLDI